MKETLSIDKSTTLLQIGQYYHIYNRGNNKENLFYKPANYLHFLGLYKKYLSNYIDTYAYCLLPNHFHILIKVKYPNEIHASKGYANLNKEDQIRIENELSNLVSNQFRIFFMSYAKGLNKQVGREGSLFRKGYRRKHVDNKNYLLRLVGYIHANAYHHRIFNSIVNYPYSSYKTLVSNNKTMLKRDEVLDWFGGKDSFINSHIATKEKTFNKRYWIEEDM